MAQSQFALLGQRRFLPFFLTQALGAFNDNAFKNALVILIAFRIAGLSAADIDFWSNLAAGLFILPFFLFSANAGQWAEKFEKSRSIWEKCADSSLAVDTEDTSSLWEFDEPAVSDGLISQMATQEDADGWGCQHALAAASNLTVETWACGYAIEDEAVTMAVDIVDNAAEK